MLSEVPNKDGPHLYWIGLTDSSTGLNMNAYFIFFFLFYLFIFILKKILKNLLFIVLKMNKKSSPLGKLPWKEKHINICHSALHICEYQNRPRKPGFAIQQHVAQVYDDSVVYGPKLMSHYVDHNLGSK